MTSEEQQYDANKERVVKYLKAEQNKLEYQIEALRNQALGFHKAIEILECKDVK